MLCAEMRLAVNIVFVGGRAKRGRTIVIMGARRANSTELKPDSSQTLTRMMYMACKKST